MVEEKFTPEEKLLKIIENTDSSDNSLEREVRKQKASVVRKRFVFGLKNMSVANLDWDNPFTTFDITNKILGLAAVLLTVLFIFDFVKDNMYLKKRFSYAIEVPAVSESIIKEPVFPSTDLAAALAKAKTRNIFTFKPEDVKARNEENKSLKKINELKLVGILWSNSPQVMIEDTASGKTYLLNNGGQVDRWQVKEIYKDRVILSGEEGESELR